MFSPTPSVRSDDAVAIWQAGVDAVRSPRLVQQALRVGRDTLEIADQTLRREEIERIVVVGGGKAGAGMAAGLEAALGPPWLQEKRVRGWINVPDDCVLPLECIHLHGARPPGVNEPTEAGVTGSERILSWLRGMGPQDLCLCLISGGGSALLPAPVAEITLEDKRAVTRHLSAAGANIRQLNTVRKHLSRLKGGGLARACRAGRLITLIISDVLGDPLDVIASGPCVPDNTTPHEALSILEQFQARAGGVSESVFQYLEGRAARVGELPRASGRVTNRIIGNNATAVRAACEEARRRGYHTRMQVAEELEGAAEDVGCRLVREALAERADGRPQAWISGGEPTVRLASPERRGRGGRNQQLVLAALQYLRNLPTPPLGELVLLAGGTDGEDGPTDAAGAWLDQQLLATTHADHSPLADYLHRNDAYHFFESFDRLLRTGPTHTNVCDLRVVLTGNRTSV